ncbi:putative pyridoxal phosphate binding protein [Thermochaetoides thermophila DSM 1495]|uniref:Molybdenum cofactor sulfurase n=1 Tax=Chaetomium thermophilum (strain DSM 1495 / CBS 144.50 / IMI 039719) TaxID=759272 RepID=G0SBH7_CHATD|nr:putative pyridoxal phosphate binding protein [Thermochaetoides thermophila DSM 1495]EGS18753.1 putative pyridoxal phosphate binding protein [Thermochaetoides thermophila DSM 1495]
MGPNPPAEGYNPSVELLRTTEYPQLSNAVYLDHAGTTPYARSLIDRFARDMTTTSMLGNPHSASSSSQLATARIEDTRVRALRFFGADPALFDLVFVANATAGIRLVADALRCDPSGGFDYVYHLASHTSLVGVREEAKRSVCVDSAQVEGWLDKGASPFEGDNLEGEEDRPILFAYPAQSNMDGRRYPLSWPGRFRRSQEAARRRAYTLLDAAALVSSSPLDLSDAETAPDFTVLSFYKIFGFPDLGALIVRRGEAEEIFQSRRYFGGGTVDMVVCLREQWHAPKTQFVHERLEDGTLPVHSIIALDAALDVHQQLFGSMAGVAAHTAFLTRRLYRGLQTLRHCNGEPVCVLYSADPDKMENGQRSGPIIAFNIRNSIGDWVSLAEVEKLATLKGFHIRTGGVCNPGGIASALGLQPWEMKQNFSAGFRCGTDNDIMAGKPTGVIRASLGAMSTITDVDSFVAFVDEFYRDVRAPSPTPLTRQLAPPRESRPSLYIYSLSIFPIKSCAKFEIPPGVDWEVRPEGLAWDREWCLVHEGTGQALSQKRYPKMALIRPRLDLEQGLLRVRYTGTLPDKVPEEISVPLSKNPALFQRPTASQFRPSLVCGEEITAQTYSSPEINSFFSAVLDVPCQLARFPAGGQGKSMRHAKAHLQKHQLSGSSRPSQPLMTANMPGAFPDGPPSPPDSDSEKRVPRAGPAAPRRILLSNESPILVITLPSVDALNREIQSRTSHVSSPKESKPISPDVFRANIVLASFEPEAVQPYAEDLWDSLHIIDKRGRAHAFDMLGACRRCFMICIDQDTAEKREEPFVTLSKTRRFDGKVFFGVHMGLAEGAEGVPTIRVGDTVAPSYD